MGLKTLFHLVQGFLQLAHRDQSLGVTEITADGLFALVFADLQPQQRRGIVIGLQRRESFEKTLGSAPIRLHREERGLDKCVDYLRPRGGRPIRRS